MNGYKLLEDSYRKLRDQEQDEETKKGLSKEIKPLDFLATCAVTLIKRQSDQY